MLKSEVDVIYRISPSVTNDELNALFAVAWQRHTWRDFNPVLNRRLAFICAYQDRFLILALIRVGKDLIVHGAQGETLRRSLGIHLISLSDLTERA